MFYEKYFNTRKYNFLIYFTTSAFFGIIFIKISSFLTTKKSSFFFLREIIGSYSVIAIGGIRVGGILAKIKSRLELKQKSVRGSH